jgi:hypothetical protein
MRTSRPKPVISDVAKERGIRRVDFVAELATLPTVRPALRWAPSPANGARKKYQCSFQIYDIKNLNIALGAARHPCLQWDAVFSTDIGTFTRLDILMLTLTNRLPSIGWL